MEGLAPNRDGGPATESGDSVVSPLSRRFDAALPSGSDGFSIECTPRSREFAGVRQSSPDAEGNRAY